MMTEWEPDDRHLDRDGEAGIEEIETVLRNHGLSLEKTITSRDVGVDMARYDLRKRQPEGWFSWQLPIYYRSKVTFFFLQMALPGAVLPVHRHDVAQFRIVLSGGLIYRGIELRSGDWIYTPPGAEYSLSVATNPGEPCLVHYAY